MTSTLAIIPVIIIIRVHRAPTVTSLHTSHLLRNRLVTSTKLPGLQSALFAVAYAPRSLRHDLTVTSGLLATNHGTAFPVLL